MKKQQQHCFVHFIETLSGRPLSIARRRTLQLASREIYDVKS